MNHDPPRNHLVVAINVTQNLVCLHYTLCHEQLALNSPEHEDAGGELKHAVMT